MIDRIHTDFVVVHLDPSGLGNSSREQRVLRCDLVHREGTAENTSSDIGNVGQLAQTLDGSVLAERPVQKR